MNYHNPSALYFLLFLIVPIVLHLINLKKPKKVFFSSIYLLKNIQLKQKKVNKINDLLLLIIRMLAIAFLIFTFSKPHKKNNKILDNNTNVKLVIDNSMSMSSQIDNINKLEIAKNLAYNYVDKISSNIELVIGNESFINLSNKDDLKRKISSVSLDDNLFSISEIINEKDTTKYNYIIFSDLQFNLEDLALFKKNDFASLISINKNNESNVYIDTCWFGNYNFNSKFYEIFVKVSNNGDFKVDNFSVFLVSDNKQITQSTIKLNSFEDTIFKLKFPINEISSGLHLLINDDSYQFDNKLYISTHKISRSKVLHITNKQTDYEFFFKSNNKLIDYKKQSYYNSLENIFNYNAVIIEKHEKLDNKSLNQILKYVKKGGVVFLSLSEKNNNTAFLSEFGVFIEKWIKSDQIVNKINYDHHIFKNVFEENVKDNLQIFKISAYNKIKNQNSHEEILNIENSSPFLLSQKYFDGNIFIMTSPIEKNLFEKSNLFAPILFNILVGNGLNSKLYQYLNNIFFEVEMTKFSNPKLIIDNKNEIQLKSKKKFGKFIIKPTDEIKLDDNYLIKYDNDSTSILSLNYNRKESRIKFVSSEIAEKFILDNDLKNIKILKAKDKTQIDIKNNTTEYWKFCLILTLLFFLFEILLIKKIENEHTN